MQLLFLGEKIEPIGHAKTFNLDFPGLKGFSRSNIFDKKLLSLLRKNPASCWILNPSSLLMQLQVTGTYPLQAKWICFIAGSRGTARFIIHYRHIA